MAQKQVANRVKIAKKVTKVGSGSALEKKQEINLLRSAEDKLKYLGNYREFFRSLLAADLNDRELVDDID